MSYEELRSNSKGTKYYISNLKKTTKHEKRDKNKDFPQRWAQ